MKAVLLVESPIAMYRLSQCTFPITPTEKGEAVLVG